MRHPTAIYVLAVAVRLVLVFGFGRYQFSWPEPVKIARSIAQGKGFADPYVRPTGPTAHSPPVYPYLIAPIYAVWENPQRAHLARMAVSCFAAGFEYALLPAAARALGLGFRTGAIAGFAGALVPLHHWLESIGEFETTLVALFIELSTIWFCRFLKAPSFSAGAAARWGVWWGFGLLLSPNLLPVLIGFAALAAWIARPRPAAVAARFATVLAGTCLLAITPWLVRNYVQLGGVFFVRDNLGLELFVSNHDQAWPDMERNVWTPFFQKRHPHPSIAASEELRRRGELEFERDRMRDALAWIRAHPGRFAELTLARVRNFWFPRNMWVLWAFTGLALIGFVMLARANRTAGAVLGSILALYPSVYYLIENGLRYQHPIYWILVLCAAWLAVRVLQRRHVLQNAE